MVSLACLELPAPKMPLELDLHDSFVWTNFWTIYLDDALVVELILITTISNHGRLTHTEWGVHSGFHIVQKKINSSFVLCSVVLTWFVYKEYVERITPKLYSNINGSVGLCLAL